MNEIELKDLLNKLNDELDKTDKVDAETLALLQELEDDLHRLGGSDAPDQDSVMERAQTLEAHFAAEHPTAARFFREIMDMLAKVGI
jgi:chorismate mutase